MDIGSAIVSIPYRYLINHHIEVLYISGRVVSIPYRYLINQTRTCLKFLNHRVSIPYRYLINPAGFEVTPVSQDSFNPL